MRTHQVKFTCQCIQYQVKLMTFNVSFQQNSKDSFHVSAAIRLLFPWFQLSAVQSRHYHSLTIICNRYISDKTLCDDTIFI